MLESVVHFSAVEIMISVRQFVFGGLLGLLFRRRGECRWAAGLACARLNQLFDWL